MLEWKNMKAILLVFDETEELSALKKFSCRSAPSPESISVSNEKLNDIKCNCVRNGALQKTKRLLKHLRKVMLLPKRDISFLRSSRFKTSEEVFRTLQILMSRYKNEDVLLFFAGHGSRVRWFLGGSGPDEKVLRYSQLEMLFNSFNGRVIIINECCHSMSLIQSTYCLAGRYLLLGCSRTQNLGEAFVSVLNEACRAWENRAKADVRVGRVIIIKDRITSKISEVDIVKGDSSVTKIHSDKPCICEEETVEMRIYPEGQEPSLRRGTDLDFLCFPPR